MRITEEQFEELLSLVDARAGMVHSSGGQVAMTLRAVLEEYESMRQPPRLGGAAELAAEYQTTKQAVTNWPYRRARNGFPQPAYKLAMGDVYDLDVVAEWKRSR